jgi:hypothetical protein
MKLENSESMIQNLEFGKGEAVGKAVGEADT